MNPSGSRSALADAIRKRAGSVTDAAGKTVRTISISDAKSAASEGKAQDIPIGDVYCRALEEEIWPLCYIRNRGSISSQEQLRLAQSRVTIVGAGGLGGYVIELLARIGIGFLAVIDSDGFDESNLNRQLLSDLDAIGRNKADRAKQRVKAVNPAVSVAAHAVRMTEENALTLLEGCHAAVDGLDNLESRRLLHSTCRLLHIPMIHGTISGFEGRLMTLFPEDPPREDLFDADGEATAESILGTPPLAPAVIGSLQAMEVIKVLLGRGQPFQGKMLWADLENGLLEPFSFSPLSNDS